VAPHGKQGSCDVDVVVGNLPLLHDYLDVFEKLVFVPRFELYFLQSRVFYFLKQKNATTKEVLNFFVDYKIIKLQIL
jgi:hypothetical protein